MIRSSRPPAPASYHHGNLAAELLVAAEAELSEKGVEAFSLRGVAKRAGVSHAAPAHHYGDATGLLTALARIGFERLLAMQRRRQAKADASPDAQLVAAGCGYVDFALASPALFRLMFSSDRPDHAEPELDRAATAAYDNLVVCVSRKLELQDQDRVRSGDDAFVESTLAWSAAHGLADLLNGKRLMLAPRMTVQAREAFVRRVLERLYGGPAPKMHGASPKE